MDVFAEGNELRSRKGGVEVMLFDVKGIHGNAVFGGNTSK